MGKSLAISLIFLLSFFGQIIAEEVSVEEARIVAKSVYYERINLIKKASFDDIGITKEFTVQQRSQALYYIFNINNNEGFVIISADDIVYPVLAYSFEGSFDPSMQPPNVAHWLNSYQDQILFAIENNLKSSEKTKSTWQKYSDYSLLQSPKSTMQVNPLVTSEWSQGGHYNDSCPEDPGGSGDRALVGCVAVAMGQIMKYHQSPTQGSGSFSYFHSTYGMLSANFGATNYNWANMPDKLNSPNSDLAQMLYHCGVASEMNYGQNASGTLSIYAKTGMITYFDYGTSSQIDYRDGYSDSKWNDLLRSELDASWPLYYAGTDTQAMSAHAFVCDGYQGSEHFHFNWGWNGWADGFFLTDDLSPGGSHFNDDQHILKIRPAGTYDFCWGLSYLNTPSGSFDDGSGDHFYNNYSMCRWLIQPSNATSITVNFNSFDTESTKDKVIVFDGDNMGSPKLGTFSGNNLPSAVTSTQGKVLIMFTSDIYVSGEGWEASYTSVTTGIDENDENHSLSVFPNPGNGVFEIEFINETTGDLKIVISDISGRQLRRFNSAKTELRFNETFDLTELTSGMYFFSVESGNLLTTRYIIIE